MPVSPAGHEEERGAARGRAVCGSAVAGRVVSAVHAGGGATDEPREAAILTAACLPPGSGGPQTVSICTQPRPGVAAALGGNVQPGAETSMSPSPDPLQEAQTP